MMIRIIIKRDPNFGCGPSAPGSDSPLFMGFLLISLMVGLFKKKEFNENIFLATWSSPFLMYILFLVAPKPDHYIFPAIMPLFLTAFDIPVYLFEKWKHLSKIIQILSLLVLGGILFLLVKQVLFSVASDILLYQEYLIENM